MSTGLEIARAKRAEMRDNGVKPSVHVTFTGDEATKLREAMKRTDYTSRRDFIRGTILAEAEKLLLLPLRTRTARDPAELEAELVAKLARVREKLKANS